MRGGENKPRWWFAIMFVKSSFVLEEDNPSLGCSKNKRHVPYQGTTVIEKTQGWFIATPTPMGTSSCSLLGRRTQMVLSGLAKTDMASSGGVRGGGVGRTQVDVSQTATRPFFFSGKKLLVWFVFLSPHDSIQAVAHLPWLIYRSERAIIRGGDWGNLTGISKRKRCVFHQKSWSGVWSKECIAIWAIGIR